MRFMRQSIAYNDWTLSVVAVFMAPFCLQIKRQISKRTPTVSTRCERVALINLLHGTLLGLYPYNLKHMTFDHRVKIAGELRKVMTSDASTQTQFIVNYEPLILFGMIEYLANVIPDFCPVEEVLLIKTMQCRFSLNQICENFRVCAMDCCASWPELNSLALTQLPVLLRQLKLNNHKFCRRPYTPPRMPTVVWTTLTQDHFYDTLMAMQHVPITGCNTIAQVKITNPTMTFHELQAVEYFWNNVFVCSLPKNIVMQQMTALDQLGSCSVHQKSFTVIHVCLLCNLRTKTSMLSQKFAYNCSSGMLQCATCSRKATPVSLLGRVLRVKSCSYYLCTKCLRPVLWDTVNTFHACSQCTLQPKAQNMSQCAVCCHKAVDAIENILHVDSLKLVNVPLCSMHSRACVRSLTYDIKSLANDLHQRVLQ